MIIGGNTITNPEPAPDHTRILLICSLHLPTVSLERAGEIRLCCFAGGVQGDFLLAPVAALGFDDGDARGESVEECLYCGMEFAHLDAYSRLLAPSKQASVC